MNNAVADALALFKEAAPAEGLKGKLYLSKTGWLLLSVPNAIGRGAFSALKAPGAEIPDGSEYNAHITVMRKAEVDKVGANNITERGRDFSYHLGKTRDFNPVGWPEMNRLWVIEARSPELERLRRSYGLPSLPVHESDGRTLQFHVTFAVRRSGVLGQNDTSKMLETPSRAEGDVYDWDKPGNQVVKASNAQHILISGHSGSGKSTLGKQLAEETGLPLVRLDKEPEIEALHAAMGGDRIQGGKFIPFHRPAEPYSDAAIKAVLDRVLAAQDPQIIEGTQIAMADPAQIEGHRKILVDKPENTIVRQRLGRDRAKEKWKDTDLSPGSPMARQRAALARDLIEVMRQGIDQYREGAEVMIPDKPKAAAAACPACGGAIIEVSGHTQCSQCGRICESCCEGGQQKTASTQEMLGQHISDYIHKGEFEKEAQSRDFVTSLWEAYGEPAVRKWIKQVDPNMELGPWEPQGSYLDHLDKQRFNELQSNIMSSATSRDPQITKILKGFNQMLGGEWTPAHDEQAKTIQGSLSGIAPLLMRYAPDWWDAMHGSSGSVASLASAIADANRHDPTFTADQAVQQAEQMAEQLLADPMSHRGFSLQELGKIYRESARRALVNKHSDIDTTLESLTPIVGAVSAVRDTAGPDIDVGDIGALFGELDKHSPDAHFDFGEAERNIRIGHHVNRTGGWMGNALARSGQTVQGTGASLAELEAQNKQLTNQAMDSEIGNMLAATARARHSGMISEGSEADKFLSAAMEGKLPSFRADQWKQMMLRSGMDPGTLAAVQRQTGANRSFMQQTPQYRNLGSAVRMNQQQFDHQPRFDAVAQRYANSPYAAELTRGAHDDLVRQWGYRGLDHYNTLQGQPAQQLGNVWNDANNRANVAKNWSHLGWAGPVQRVVDEVKRGTPSATEVGAAALGGVRVPEGFPKAGLDEEANCGSPDRTELCKEANLPPWAWWGITGAGLGGLSGAITSLEEFDYDKNDQPAWLDLLQRTATGAAIGGGAGLGANYLLRNLTHSLAPEGSTHDVATLRGELEPIYENAPGGLDKAVELAQEHMPAGEQYGLHDWKPSDLDTKVNVYTAPPGQPLLEREPGIGGLAQPGVSRNVYVGHDPDNPDATTEFRQHEITHAALRPSSSTFWSNAFSTPETQWDSPSGVHVTLEGPPEKFPEVARNHPLYTDGKLELHVPWSSWNYLSSQEEMKAYLSHVKRQYVAETGRHIDTAEEAQKAIDWWVEEHPFSNQTVLIKGLQQDREGSKALIQQLLQVVGLTDEAASKIAMDKEAIRGIPDRTDFGDPSDLDDNSIADLFVQKHRAQRAGEHYDYRLGTPETGLYSWATKPLTLPGPGEKKFMRQQPIHSHAYGSFSGSIGSGYGKGEVRKEQQERVLITKAAPDKIEYTIASKGTPERFVLMRPQKWGEREWLLINVTPTKPVPYDKTRYKKIPAEQVEPYIEQMQQGTSAQAKLDGASSLIKIMKNGAVEIMSYRTATNTGHPIVHTERVFGERPKLDIPKKYEGSVLKGELYAQKRDTGEVLPPQQLGGHLHATIENTLGKQEQQGVDIKEMLYDIQQLGKQHIDQEEVPYADRRKMLEEIMQFLPEDRFHLAEEATTPEEASNLWRQILEGNHPLTREGMVLHPPQGRPIKAKPLEESDVHITGVFPGTGRLKGVGAGGFEYALESGGAPVGKVGTGFTDELRKQMWSDPDSFVGRVARIHSQEQHPSGAWRAPALLALHEDYPTREETQ